MAAVDVVIVAPPPAPPVPVVRMNRLALAAADAVVCLWIASLWALFASVAAVIIGLLACGSGCTCTDAASTAVLVSVLFFVIVCPCASLKVPDAYNNQLQKGAAALEPISEAVVKAHLIAITAFVYLEFLGILLKLIAINDPPTSRTASAIMLLPPLGICVMCCLVSLPFWAVRLWKMIRHGRASASVVPI